MARWHDEAFHPQALSVPLNNSVIFHGVTNGIGKFRP
jgi:hypothetical protein